MFAPLVPVLRNVALDPPWHLLQHPDLSQPTFLYYNAWI